MNIENKDKIIEGLKNTLQKQQEKIERYEKVLKSTESYIFANSLIPVKQREDLQRIIVPALND